MNVDPASGFSMAAFRSDKQQQVVQAQGVIDTLNTAKDISKTTQQQSQVPAAPASGLDIKV